MKRHQQQHSPVHFSAHVRHVLSNKEINLPGQKHHAKNSSAPPNTQPLSEGHAPLRQPWCCIGLTHPWMDVSIFLLKTSQRKAISSAIILVTPIRKQYGFHYPSPLQHQVQRPHSCDGQQKHKNLPIGIWWLIKNALGFRTTSGTGILKTKLFNRHLILSFPDSAIELTSMYSRLTSCDIPWSYFGSAIY